MGLFELGLRNTVNKIKIYHLQEVEPSVGEVLCRMFEDDLTVDLSRIARHLKQRKKLGDGYHRKSRDHHTTRFVLICFFFTIWRLTEFFISTQYLHVQS